MALLSWQQIGKLAKQPVTGVEISQPAALGGSLLALLLCGPPITQALQKLLSILSIARQICSDRSLPVICSQAIQLGAAGHIVLWIAAKLAASGTPARQTNLTRQGFLSILLGHNAHRAGG